MPEHCIKQYEKMMRSRVPRSKPLQVIKEKGKLHSYKYHAIDPETLPSSNELNSINNMISYNDLGTENNYYDLVSSNQYNIPASPNKYKDLISSNLYHVPPISNQYNDWTSTSKYDEKSSANNLDASVQHIDIDDLVPLRNGRRVDNGNDREDDDNIDHDQSDGDQGYSGDHEGHADRHEDYNLRNNGHHGDRYHYIDLGRHGHRGEYKDNADGRHHSDNASPRRKTFRKKHKKRVHQFEPMYSQDSLELVYNSLHNVMNVEQFNMNMDDESSGQTRSRNHNSRHSRNRKRQRARHHERDLLQDHKRRLKQNSDFGLLYDYGHGSKRGRSYPRSDNDDESDSYEYQNPVNDISHEYDIDKYVNEDARFDAQNIGEYLTINTDPTISTSGSRRRPRQNFPQDAIFAGDNVSPFSIESYFDLGSLSSDDDDEPVHIPIPGYQSPVQSMLQAIESDVRNQPIAPQIGVLPFLGVSAIYHQPISKNSVDLIKDVAHSYQEAVKEQYKEMAKYFPPLPSPPPFPLPDSSENITTIKPVPYYPGQRKADKLINKIRHKILENAKHFRKDGVNKHRVNKGGSSQEDIFLKQYK